MSLNKRFIQSLKFISFLVIGILLLWLAFRNVNFKNLKKGLADANYYWLILSSLFGLFAYLSRSRRWILLINPLGYHPSFKNTYNALMSGYLANLALPRMGEITRCIALGKKEKIPIDQLIGTVVVERTIDFISLLIIMVVMIITSQTIITQFLKESILKPIQQKILSPFGITWVFWAFLGAVVAVVLILMIGYRKNLRKIRFFAKFFEISKGIINGLKTITGLKRKWEFIFHTVFIWLNYALMAWVVVFSLKSTSHLTFLNSIFILVIGGLAMSAPVQSGLGAFHYIVSRGLVVVMGVKLEDGLVYALLSHESQLIYILIVGTISFFAMFGFSHRNKEQSDLQVFGLDKE